jgi:hypothetical protein
MITAEQIPEAVAHAAEAAWSKDATWKEVVAAALNAWPVNSTVWNEAQRDDGSYSTITLPIQEPRDE